MVVGVNGPVLLNAPNLAGEEVCLGHDCATNQNQPTADIIAMAPMCSSEFVTIMLVRLMVDGAIGYTGGNAL